MQCSHVTVCFTVQKGESTWPGWSQECLADWLPFVKLAVPSERIKLILPVLTFARLSPLTELVRAQVSLLRLELIALQLQSRIRAVNQLRLVKLPLPCESLDQSLLGYQSLH